MITLFVEKRTYQSIEKDTLRGLFIGNQAVTYEFIFRKLYK
jgi:hypothetical protein